MNQNGEEVIRKGSFQKVAFSSAKKLTCDEGELTLTSTRLLINCKESWSRSLSIREIRLEAWEMNLEVYDFLYGKLMFRFNIDNASEWEKAFRELTNRYYNQTWNELYQRQSKKPEELNTLFDLKPETLRKILAEVRKERLQFGLKNIDFILNVQNLVNSLNNRKLKAFILAHCYIAWYEWTKSLLYKIYKGKFGKAPRDDKELLEFLSGFPSLGVLDTSEWGINANQMRNCVAHERFYYNYKKSELVFRVDEREKRIRLRDLQWRFASIAYTYETLLKSLKQKVESGKIICERAF
jgi:hypothetical protein